MLGESQLDAAMAILADTDHDQHEVSSHNLVA